MARKSSGAALASAIVYGFASGIGRQAARDAYKTVTDSKLQPDSSQATIPINEEAGEVVFDYIKKDSQGNLRYVWHQELPLVWYDKRWKKFREGCYPDGRKTESAECSVDKQELDKAMKERGVQVIVRSNTVVNNSTYREAEKQNTVTWLWAIIPWGILIALGFIIASVSS